MKRGFRLTQTTDFKRVRRYGKSYAHPLVVLVAQASGQEVTRAAVVAGVVVGPAVVRNRAKRRLRACLDEFFPALYGGWDLIVIARKPITEVEFVKIRSALRKLLAQAGVLDENKLENCD